MSLGVERKVHDLAKVQELLREYRQIELLATEGDPPEYYEFVFHLLGAETGPDGQPQMEQSHRLSVRLSFGYPHLPPSCKPLSPIFHPNVDPDAVQIDDFWQHDRGLDELVLHLGHMLCGKIFDTRNPFNPEAAAWYATRKAELPWDRLESGQELRVEPVAEEKPESSFSVDWDYEKEAGLVQEVEEASGGSTAQEDVEELRKAIAECRFYAADKMLAGITDATVLPDREGIAEYIKGQITLAEQRRQTARAQEHAGKGSAALRLLEQVAGQIADAPGLGEEIARLKQLGPPSSTPPFSAPSPPSGIDQAESPVIPSVPLEPEPVAVAPKMQSFPRGVPKGVLLGGGALFLLVCALLGGWLFWADHTNRRDAETAWKQAQESMRKKQFAEAKATAERGAALLRKLRLPAGQDAGQLLQQVTTLLNSRELAEGLKGNLLYHGVYLPAETIRALEEGETLIAKAEELEGQSRWQEAAGLYEEVLRGLGAGGEKTGERLPELRFKLARSKYQAAMQSGRSAEANASWREAAVYYRVAGDLAQVLEDPAAKTEFDRRSAELELRHLREQGRKAVQANNWPEAVEWYRQAQAHVDEVGGFPVALREELQRGEQQARFSQILLEAKKAVEQSAWDAALGHYDEALAFLRGNPRLKEIGTDSDTLRRERVLVVVARERQLADEAKRQQNLAEEIGHVRKILAELDRSDVRRDEQLRLLRQESASRMVTLEHEEEVARLTRHLYDKFNEIFLETYPSSRSSQLLQPRVVFLGQDGKTMLFNLQCVEVNQGRRFRLELNYLFDGSSNSWRLAPSAKK